FIGVSQTVHMKKFSIETEYQVDVEDLAYLVNLTPRRVQQLEVEGVIEKLEHGKYDLIECVRSIIDARLRSASGSVASEAEKTQRTRLTKAKADIAELNRRELAGDLVRVDVQRRNLDQLAREVRSNLETIPDRNAGILAGETDKGKTHQILANEIRQALEDIGEKLLTCLVEDPHAYVESND
ncbi:MAG: hypothetical protein ACR2Q3_01525, partial [Woeseiaceae bacterium]